MSLQRAVSGRAGSHGNTLFALLARAAVTAVCVVSLSAKCGANINLFVDKHEVRRLTGVMGSPIYYIQEGVVNEYASRYIVPVSANVSRLNFHWQSLIRKPIPYEIAVKWNDIQAIKQVLLNISQVGYVPRVQQVFSVVLPCTGQLSTLVDVQILMNISTYSRKHPFLALALKRTKTCLLGYSDPAGSSHAAPPGDSVGAGVLVAVGVFVAVAVTVSVMTVTTLAYRKYRLNRLTVYTSTKSSGSEVFLKKLARNCHSVDRLVRSSSYLTTANLHKLIKQDKSSQALISSETSTSEDNRVLMNCMDKKSTHYASSNIGQISAEEPRYANQQASSNHVPLENSGVAGASELPVLDRQCLQLSEQLLVSDGCQLWRGRYRAPLSGSAASCLVKYVSQSSRRHAQVIEEARLMLSRCCDVVSVVTLIGVCGTDEGALSLVYTSLSDHCTNLKLLLGQCHQSSHTLHSIRPISEQIVVDMARQVFSAVSHIHSKRILHKDLAARNFIVDGNWCVRLSDAVFSPNLFPGEYVTTSSAGVIKSRPIRWMAPELFELELFSVSSDVWSAAVTCWEIAGLCANLPYNDLRDSHLPRLIGQGLRLDQPKHCCRTMYEVLCSCWHTQPHLRPSAQQTCHQLQQLSVSYDRLI